jgi:hypothetical protein
LPQLHLRQLGAQILVLQLLPHLAIFLDPGVEFGDEVARQRVGARVLDHVELVLVPDGVQRLGLRLGVEL